MKRLCILASILIAAVVAVRADGQDVTIANRLALMADLDHLAKPPAVGEKHVQFSSFDPASKKGPADGDSWFANGDCGQYLRIEKSDRGEEFVMADTAGPGMITRIWSANPNGHLRVYIDGEKVPLIDAKMSELLGGGLAWLPKPLSEECSKGWNLYLPIPFAKHLKVTATTGGFYYHVNVTQYPPETKVESLTPAILAASHEKIAAAAKALTAASTAPNLVAGQEGVMTREFVAAAESSPDLGFDLPDASPHFLRDLTMTDLSAENRAEALARCMLILGIDGVAAVRVPLGAFFGCGPRAGLYESLVAGVTQKDGKAIFWNRFPIPFLGGFRIILQNPCKFKVSCSFSWRVQEIPEMPGLRFGVVHREESDVPSWPHRDHNMCDLIGGGRVVGAVMTIRNPVRAWWGEGDEKIYTDGEKFPSIFGTGTEDYFGYAWCWPVPFKHPYHAQPACDGPGNYGFTTINRWHVIDQIPFSSGLKFDMELWHWVSCNVDFSTTVFFYGTGPTRDRNPYAFDRFPKFRDIEPYRPMRVAGAIEGEEMKFKADGGKAEVQTIEEIWSNDRQIWWMDPEVGRKLTARFGVEVPGRYRVFGKFTVANDYGRHAISIGDGAPKEIDFWADRLGTKEIDLGTFDLSKSDHTITVRCVGKNDKAVDRKMFGLDYIRLEAVK